MSSEAVAVHVDDAFEELLRSQLADPSRVTRSESVLALHGEAMLSRLRSQPPEAVVFPSDTAEVARVLALCNERGVPVIPFGAGTSVYGHVLAPTGGVSLDLSGMDGVLELDAENLTITVQPGVLRSRVNEAAGEHGLFFPVDPGADASIGGMISTNASGTTTVRYGSMRHQVLALEAVLADGRVIRTGTKARKSSAGYDLTSLLVGAEGTLAVITEATIRLYGVPDYTSVLRALFPDVESACRCAARCMALGLAVTRLELLDEDCMKAINAFAGGDFPEQTCLLIESAGGEAGVDEEIELVKEIATEEGGHSFVSESDPTARAQLWRVRHDLAFALRAMAPGKETVGSDVCVPVSRLAEAVAQARATFERHGIDNAVIAGHVGDGNYHAVFMIDNDDPAEVARADQVSSELIEQALALGGTCSGEHGIGIGKKPYLIHEHGDLVPLMRAIKADFDPNWILNPSKIFDVA